MPSSPAVTGEAASGGAGPAEVQSPSTATPSSGLRLPRRLWTTPAFVLLIVPLGVLLSSLAARPLWHTDLWGHLAYGRLIWEQRSLPATEPLMPLSRGVEFVDTAWLSQIAGFLVLEQWGLPGLQFLAAACVTAAAAILCWAGYRKTGDVAFTLLGLAAFVWLSWKQLFNGADYSIVIRPQLAGLVAFTIALVVCISRPARWHWIVVPVTFAAWANLHGSFLAGLGLLAAFAVGQAGDVLRRTDTFAAIVRSWAFWRRVLLLELAAAAVLLNPYGLRLYADVWLFGQNANLPSIVEWQALTLRMTQGQAMAGVSLVLLFLYRMTPRRITAGEVLALLLFGGLTLWTSRMIVWFAPVAAYYVMLHGSACWQRHRVSQADRDTAATTAELVPASPARPLWTVIGVAAAWVAFATTPLAQRLVHGPRPQDDFAISLQTPAGVARHLAEERAVGQVFNTMELGDYLLWTHPGLPVFVAGHAHLVPDEVWRDYLSTIRGGAGWLATLDRYEVNTVILDLPNRQSLADQLAEEPEWEQRYEDRNSAVFRRIEPLR